MTSYDALPAGLDRRRVLLYFPAVYLDALQPGEYGEGRLRCMDCGCVQPLPAPAYTHLRWCCVEAGCEASGWVERLSV